MTLLSTTPQPANDAVAEAALRRWARERLRRQPRADGGAVYTFALSGSTCGNVPLEVVMTVVLDAQGRIEAATSAPAPADRGCNATCAADGDGKRFWTDAGSCEDVVGLTLAEAAHRNWDPETSGCFCSAGNRRHKWRNVFQTIHYAETHPDR